ncbi:hypothetical protein THAOC_09040 [Thalassiosira oceanica]|uniref:Uncharacterized protein n=1 Tax=Thalassiosira oceanica TaxID=159749 RepID=K0TGV5_THAOC|nr:hypothetical protein THAOC_09040 [Thalassiosira oceanica]|eukprot:EJK69677.1 hypothetical protein THAOC_09040 [Thalassiosira oceanica]
MVRCDVATSELGDHGAEDVVPILLLYELKGAEIKKTGEKTATLRGGSNQKSNGGERRSDYQKALEDELKKTIAVCVMAALAGVGAVGVSIQLDLFAGSRDVSSIDESNEREPTTLAAQLLRCMQKAERCGSLRESQARHARTNSSARISGVNRASRAATLEFRPGQARAPSLLAINDESCRQRSLSGANQRCEVGRVSLVEVADGPVPDDCSQKKGRKATDSRPTSWMTARRTGRFQDLKDGTYGFE